MSVSLTIYMKDGSNSKYRSSEWEYTLQKQPFPDVFQKNLQHRFSSEYYEIFKNSFFIEQLGGCFCSCTLNLLPPNYAWTFWIKSCDLLVKIIENMLWKCLLVVNTFYFSYIEPPKNCQTRNQIFIQLSYW